MTAYLPLLIALIGLIVWFISTNPKLAEAAKWAYVTGLLAFLLQTNQLVRLL